jgi:hypothetical protein
LKILNGILLGVLWWGNKRIPDLHSTEVLAELNPWEVQTVADQPLDVYKIMLAQIRLRGHVKICVIDTSD